MHADCIFSSLKKFDDRKGTLEAWSKVVARNKILQLIRKNKKAIHPIYKDDLEIGEIEENDWKLVASEELVKAIQKLPDGYREVLNMYAFEEMSHKEISEVLGIYRKQQPIPIQPCQILFKTLVEAENRSEL